MPPQKTESQKDVSQQMIIAFQPVKWFLQFFLRFPFKTKPKIDGTWAFEYHPRSFAAISFYVSTLVAVVVFLMILVGAIFGYIGDPGRPHDRCDFTWQAAVMTRQFVPIMFSMTQLFTTMVGSLYVLWHAKKFVHLFNFWNKALQQLNFDPTEGVREVAIRGHILFIGLVIFAIIVYATGKLEPLEEASGFFIQSLVYFFYPSLYTHKTRGPLPVSEFKELSDHCCDCQPCYSSQKESDCVNVTTTLTCWNALNHPSKEYEMIKGVGFFIQLYGMMGARCLILQFEFFCHLMINTCRVWNKRLSNGLSLLDRTVDNNDPERRRLGFQLLLMDHATIIQLFSMTEDNFTVVLCTYYMTLFINIICQFYYIALLNSQLTCAEAVQKEMDFETRCSNYFEMKQNGDNGDLYSFEDPCINLGGLRIQSAWVSVIILGVTLFMFITSVSEAAEASSEGTAGFVRLRKHGYMCCQTKQERHFIHTLVFSFVGPNPIQISAGGYFVLRRRIILIVIATCFMYFLIIMGFKPGVIKPAVQCLNVDGFPLVQYPRVL